jgi:hypothetical protein
MARTVLVVDDHAPFRAVVRTLLQLGGFQVARQLDLTGDLPAIVPVSKSTSPTSWVVSAS